jgi:hypothetical protein
VTTVDVGENVEVNRESTSDAVAERSYTRSATDVALVDVIADPEFM